MSQELLSLFMKEKDKSEEDKSVEEKKSSVQDLENMLIIMKKIRDIL